MHGNGVFFIFSYSLFKIQSQAAAAGNNDGLKKVFGSISTPATRKTALSADGDRTTKEDKEQKEDTNRKKQKGKQSPLLAVWGFFASFYKTKLRVSEKTTINKVLTLRKYVVEYTFGK